MEKRNNSVQTKLIVPVILFLATLLLSFFAVLSYVHFDNLNRNSQLLLNSANNSIRQSLLKQQEILLLLSDRVADADLPQSPLLPADRQRLLKQFEQGYERIRVVHDVTHFYFYDVQGMNIARLHQPNRFGDQINRYTLQNTIKTGTPTAGLELGPLGTITMRLVSPIRSGGNLIGYLELGKELESTMQQVEELLSTPIAVFINKQKLNKYNFLSNADITGRDIAWGKHPIYLTYYVSPSILELESDFSSLYASMDGPSSQDYQTVTISNSKWRLSNTPLFSVSGEELGRILLFQNIDAQFSNAYQLTLSFFLVTLVIVLLLTSAFYAVLGRVDRKINAQRQALVNSEAGLKEAQSVGRIGNWCWDIKEQTLTVSDELLSVLELHTNERPTHLHQFSELLQPDDGKTLLEHLQKLEQAGNAFTFTAKLAQGGKEQKHAQFRSRYMHDQAHSRTLLVGTIQDVSDLIVAKELLEESKEAYKQLIESTEAIPWKLSPEKWQFTYVGPQAKNVLGYDQSDWYKEGFWRDHIHPQDLYKLGICKQQTQIHEKYRFEFRLKNKAGSYLWFSTDVSRFTDRNNNTLLQGFMFDISERQKQEIVLREIASGVAYNVGRNFLSQLTEQIQRIFNSHYIFIASLSNDKSALDTTVFMQDGKLIDNVCFPIDKTPHQQALLQRSCVYADDLQVAFPVCFELKQLQVNSYVGRSLVNSKGEDIGLIAVMNRGPIGDLRIIEEVLTIFAVRAATELEQSYTRKQLRQKEVESEQILRAVLDGVITIDQHGTIMTMNKAAEDMFGWPAEEAMGQNVSMLMPSSHANNHDKYILNYLQTGDANIIGSGRELEGLKRTGKLFPIRLSVSEMNDEISGKRLFIGTIMDLTAAKEQEAIIRRTQKMDAVGKLTGGLAHDYNNILGIVMGYVELLDQMLPHDSNLRNFTKEIYKASERGSKLAKKLLAFSRNVSKEVRVCSVNTLLLEQKEMLETTLTTRISFVMRLASDIWLSEFDPSEFEDAILNMTLNASHALSGQGEFHIMTNNVELNEQDAQRLELPSGSYVRVLVQDNGSGMDDDTQNRIFEPFYSTKGEQGTGLGLSSVYGFIKRSKGAISVDSSVGKGTSFSLYFPKAQRAESRLQQQGQSSDDSLLKGRETILVVDDEPALVALMASVLRGAGYTTFEAKDGTDALKVLEQHTVQMVISDVVMPIMDGYELAKQIRKQYHNIALLLVSGYDEKRPKDTSIELEVMSKPYSNQSLLLKVREILDAL